MKNLPTTLKGKENCTEYVVKPSDFNETRTEAASDTKLSDLEDITSPEIISPVTSEISDDEVPATSEGVNLSTVNYKSSQLASSPVLPRDCSNTEFESGLFSTKLETNSNMNLSIESTELTSTSPAVAEISDLPMTQSPSDNCSRLTASQDGIDSNMTSPI